MHLFYVDESGNTGANLDTPDQPVHWIVAIGVTPVALKAIEADMLALALRTFRSRARAADFEFHGSHIFRGNGDCAGVAPADRVRLYDELLSLVGKHDCKLFIQGIDKARHKARAAAHGYVPWHPHRLGFMYLLERIDEWLEEEQPEPTLFGEPAAPLYGLIVADEQKEVDRDIVQRFAFWREAGTDFGSYRELRYLIDTVHYVPSHDSWLIQLADCVAYLRNRVDRLRRAKGSNRTTYTSAEAAVDRLWRDYCQPKVVREYLWP
jgi:hypothetical protein